MVGLNAAYRYYRSAPTANVGGIPPVRTSIPSFSALSFVVPITKQLKFSASSPMAKR